MRDLGLVVVWDDGDDLHADEHAPYPHARDVLVQRAWLDNCAAVVAGTARTAEAALLVESGWAHELVADRAAAPRRPRPRVQALGEDFELARDAAARSARLPSLAHEAARRALAAGTPVLVQVPRRGYVPVAGLRPVPRAGPVRALRRSAGHLPAPRPGRRPDPGLPLVRPAGGHLRLPALPRHQAAGRRSSGSPGRPRSSPGPSPGAAVRTSGSTSGVLATVPGGPALVVATPGAEPVAEGGYGAALLLDSWALLGRADLRAGEETLRRWMNAATLVRPAVGRRAGGRRRRRRAPRRPGAGAVGPGLAGRARAGRPPRAGLPAGHPDGVAVGSPAALAEFLEALRLPAAPTCSARCPSRRGRGRRASGSATSCGCRAPRAWRWRTRWPRCRACAAPRRPPSTSGCSSTRSTWSDAALAGRSSDLRVPGRGATVSRARGR